MHGFYDMSKIRIRDMDFSVDSKDIKTLSNLLLLYTTNNFVKTYKDSNYIDDLLENITYEKVIDDDSISPIERKLTFVSKEDITEYFLRNQIQKFTPYQLSQYVGGMKICKVMDIEDTSVSFLIGSISESKLSIEILVSSPNISRYGLTTQFLVVCLNKIKSDYDVKDVFLNINKDFTDTKKIKSFLHDKNFEFSEQQNGYILHIQ